MAGSQQDATDISQETMRLFTWCVYCVLCQAIDCFGIATNIINIICFVKQGFKDSVNVSLLGLSVSDLGCLITLSWINICMSPPFTNGDWSFDPMEVIYLVLTMPHFAFSRVTNWITALITLERCLCIMAPFKIKYLITPKITAIIIVGVYIIFIFSSAPVYVVNRLGMKFSPLRNKTVLGLIFTEERETVEQIAFALNNFTIPLTAFLIIVVCTVILTLGLKRADKWRKQTVHSEANNRNNQKVAKMIVMISTLFIACFIPINISMLAIAFEPGLTYGGKYINIEIMLAGVSFVLESVNSSANIFLYYNMSSKYRDTFRSIFCKRKQNVKEIVK